MLSTSSPAVLPLTPRDTAGCLVAPTGRPTIPTAACSVKKPCEPGSSPSCLIGRANGISDGAAFRRMGCSISPKASVLPRRDPLLLEQDSLLLPKAPFTQLGSITAQ